MDPEQHSHPNVFQDTTSFTQEAHIDSLATSSTVHPSTSSAEDLEPPSYSGHKTPSLLDQLSDLTSFFSPGKDTLTSEGEIICDLLSEIKTAITDIPRCDNYLANLLRAMSPEVRVEALNNLTLIRKTLRSASGKVDYLVARGEGNASLDEILENLVEQVRRDNYQKSSRITRNDRLVPTVDAWLNREKTELESRLEESQAQANLCTAERDLFRTRYTNMLRNYETLKDERTAKANQLREFQEQKSRFSFF